MPEQFYNVATYLARDSVGYLVRRLYSILSSRLEASFADHGFTLMQWGVLMHLRDGLARTASDIAIAFQHDSGALTRVLDHLEEGGFLRRRRSVRDRRVVELELTREGREVVAELLPTVVAEMNAGLAPLSRAEFEQFRGTLMRILEHLQPGAMSALPAPATAKAKAATARTTSARRRPPAAKATASRKPARKRRP
jgi:DNA-binding MarR family transcriptional regulator